MERGAGASNLHMIMYKVVECGINTEVYDEVMINEDDVSGKSIGNLYRKAFESSWLSVDDRPDAAFENHVKEGSIRTLQIKKHVVDKDNNELDDDTEFTYRLYLGNFTG